MGHATKAQDAPRRRTKSGPRPKTLGHGPEGVPPARTSEVRAAEATRTADEVLVATLHACGLSRRGLGDALGIDGKMPQRWCSPRTKESITLRHLLRLAAPEPAFVAELLRQVELAMAPRSDDQPLGVLAGRCIRRHADTFGDAAFVLACITGALSPAAAREALPGVRSLGAAISVLEGALVEVGEAG